MAGDAIDLQEVARSQILDPCGVEEHSPTRPCSRIVLENPWSRPGQPPISPRARGCCGALGPVRPVGGENRARQLTIGRGAELTGI
jgi:hypothetical protein